MIRNDEYAEANRTRPYLLGVADELGLEANALTDDALLNEILAAPGGRKLLVGDDPRIHRGPRALFRMLSRPDGYVDSGTDWIAFNSDDAYIEVRTKEGSGAMSDLSIDAYLLAADDDGAPENEALSWIDRQPKPTLGLLTVGHRRLQDQYVYMPRLSVDVKGDSIVGEFIQELIFPYAEAWDHRTGVVDAKPGLGGPDAAAYRVRDATEIPPKNAWLLVGGEESFPTAADLSGLRLAADAGIYDHMWTAPKNGEVGDLVVIYFVSPKKSAHFVARLASQPFWRTDVEAVAATPVDRHQWWAFLTPLVEIEPIPYAALQEAADGFLPLRGRSGHYLSPRVISRLTFNAKRSPDRDELHRVAAVPVGMTELPDWADRSLEGWRNIPGGLLPLEAKVSEHIVEPLLDLVWDAPYGGETHPLVDRTLGPVLAREHRVPSGYVDYVFEYPVGVPALAVEVKLTMNRPASGVWADSPDFQQLQRYAADLGTPGVLVDAQRILLVAKGADAPHAEIIRAEATWADIEMIRDLLVFEPVRTVDQRPAVPARRVTRRG
jgi:hypothetical protein